MFLLLALLTCAAHVSAADLFPGDLEALLRSAGGQYILSELGMMAENLDATRVGPEKLRPLTDGMDEIRDRYLSAHPDERDLLPSK